MKTCEELRRYVGIEPGESWPANAWPGCYRIVYIADDGESICAECMNTQAEIHFGGDADGWRIEGAMAYGVDADYPEADEFCAHCNNLISEGEL